MSFPLSFHALIFWHYVFLVYYTRFFYFLTSSCSRKQAVVELRRARRVESSSLFLFLTTPDYPDRLTGLGGSRDKIQASRIFSPRFSSQPKLICSLPSDGLPPGLPSPSSQRPLTRLSVPFLLPLLSRPSISSCPASMAAASLPISTRRSSNATVLSPDPSSSPSTVLKAEERKQGEPSAAVDLERGSEIDKDDPFTRFSREFELHDP